MENVPEVIGANNVKHFAKWLEKLESLGYHCYWQVLNAKDYGIPQNRERCFMVSILGDYYYEFPNTIKLEHKLKDLLEDEVDESFYLSDRAIKGIQNTNFNCSTLDARTEKNGIMPTLCARDYKDPKLVIEIKGKEYPIIKDNENFIQWKQKGFLDSDCRAWKDETVSGTLTTNGKNKIAESLTLNTNNKRIKKCAEKLNTTIDGQFVDIFNNNNREDGVSGALLADMNTHQGNIIYSNYRIRKLTPRECFRLMGVKDKDYEKIAENQSNASLYHLAGDSLVTFVLVGIIGNMFNNFNKEKFDKILYEFYLQISK